MEEQKCGFNFKVEEGRDIEGRTKEELLDQVHAYLSELLQEGNNRKFYLNIKGCSIENYETVELSINIKYQPLKERSDIMLTAVQSLDDYITSLKDQP